MLSWWPTWECYLSNNGPDADADNSGQILGTHLLYKDGGIHHYKNTSANNSVFYQHIQESEEDFS